MSAFEIRQLSWNQLKKNYWMVFITTLIVYALYSTGLAIVGLIISGPVAVGYSMYLINTLNDYKKADELETLFHGFKNNLNTAIIAYILRMIFVVLWSLLLIIPGIIKFLAFRMTEYIIAEHPELTATEALDRSQALMKGHKWRLFCLLFSFIGWYALAALTFGIGFIFLLPYVNTAIANFYVDIRGSKSPNIEIEH